MGCFREKPEAMGKPDLIFHFFCRAVSDFQETDVFSFRRPCAAFDNVRRDRDCAPSHLRYEAVTLISGEVLRLAVCKDYETMGELERVQLAMVSHSSIAPLIE